MDGWGEVGRYRYISEKRAQSRMRGCKLISRGYPHFGPVALGDAVQYKWERTGQLISYSANVR